MYKNTVTFTVTYQEKYYEVIDNLITNNGNKKLGEFIYNNILNTDNVVEVNKEENK